MAEFLNQTKDKAEDYGPDAGFNALGKPVPFHRRETAYEHARQMGCNEADAFAVISAMCLDIERDEPYGAMKAAIKYVDLTGTYRLMAVLLTAAKGE